ncbi:hypothetical protein AB4Z54_49675, partial [Streptomyces sp. MCAF7]
GRSSADREVHVLGSETASGTAIAARAPSGAARFGGLREVVAFARCWTGRFRAAGPACAPPYQAT